MAAEWPINSFQDWWALKETIKEEATIASKQRKHAQQQKQHYLKQNLERAIKFGDDAEIKEALATWHTFETQRGKEILHHWISKWKLNGDQLGKLLMWRVSKAQNKQKMYHMKTDLGSLVEGNEMLEYVTDWYAKLFQGSMYNSKVIRDEVDKLWGKGPTWEVKYDTSPLQHMHQVVKRARRDKAPGEDGLPAELYQQAPHLVNKLWEAWEKDSGNWSSGVGIITLLFKKGDRLNISNWRPITLLNYDHKILAGLLLSELKVIAKKTIGKFQHGFIPGRKIGDAILRIKAAQALIKLRQTGGILCIDFKKAYDTLQQQWIWLSLEKLGVPTSLIHQCKQLTQKGKSCVTVNGKRGSAFDLNTGV